MEDLSSSETYILATDMALASVTGDDIFNFGKAAVINISLMCNYLDGSAAIYTILLWVCDVACVSLVADITYG